MILEVVPVTRHSSSWNMDYGDRDLFMVCECGERVKLHALLGERNHEEQLVVIEHSIKVLGDLLPRGETVQDRYS